MVVRKTIRKVNNIWENQQPFVSLYLTKNIFSWYLCYYMHGAYNPSDTSALIFFPCRKEGGDREIKYYVHVPKCHSQTREVT